MNGGEIKNNTAKYGGGVSIYNAAFTLKDGAISNNTAARDAGGVRLFGGTFTMEGGVIEGNRVTGTSTASGTGRAGGVEIVAATMNMKGGEIKNNTAKNGGGGVSLGLSGADNAVLNMSGGTISGNTLTNPAGTGKGVEFFTGSTTHSGTTYYTIMKMSGSAKVDTNNDVYVNDSRMITVDGALTGTAPAARLTPKTYAAGRQVLDGSAVGTEYAKFAVTPQAGTPSLVWTIKNNGRLRRPPVTITINGSDPDKWKKLKDAVQAAVDGDVFIIDGIVQSTSASGNNGEIAVTKNITVQGKNGAGTDILDANESAFAHSDKHRIFKVTSGTLTLKKLTLKGGSAEKGASGELNASGGGILLESGGVSLNDVTVSGCKARRASVNKGNGGAIYVKSGSLNMENAALSANTADDGGAIYIEGGTVTLINATIGGEQYHDGTDSAKTKGNKAKNGGGIYVTGGALDIKGCTFTYNDSGSGTGGGIKAENIALAMTDCTLTGNKAGAGGGGILTSGTCSLTMKTCILTGNAANFNGGGGVYASGSSFTMTDCTLTGNVAKNTGGGGVYVADGTFTMKGSSRITPTSGAEENEQGKNEVFLTNGKMITIPAALTGTVPVARITPAAYNTTTQVLTGSAVGTEHRKFRVTPEPATPPKIWSVGTDGKLKRP